MHILDAAATARALPWPALLQALQTTLADDAAGRVQAPPRWVLPLAPGTAWFVMPAWLAPEAGDLAAIKLITHAAANPALGLPAILGDVLVLRASTGQRLALLDGPTVTARRTAAVTLLAVRALAAQPAGPLLVIGTGVQARAHVQALVAGGGVRQLWVRGRTPARSREFVQALQADQAAGLADDLSGDRSVDRSVDRSHDLPADLQITPADDLAAALAHCPLVVTATPARAICLHGPVRPDAFIAAIGAYSATMIELSPALTCHLAASGRLVLDSPAARHEAGDLLAAGLATAALPTLADVLADGLAGAQADTPAHPQAAPHPGGPVLFKSCGAALWDLAAARCAVDALNALAALHPPPAITARTAAAASAPAG